MRTLVAGGAGFVGSHLCARLLREGDEVVCLDNLSTGSLGNLHTLLDHPRFSFVQADVTEELPPLPDVERVYHLASPASPLAYQKRPIETLRANSDGTDRLLRMSVRLKARFLYASTSEIYGDPLEHPQRESYSGHVSSVGPRSMYDEAKRYGEALTVAFGRTAGIDVRIARIFNTYGPHMDVLDGRVVSNFAIQALSGLPLTMYGDGTQTRSFQYVDDLVEGLVRLMASDYPQPVNLGNPVEFTIAELASLVQELTGTRCEIVCLPLPGHDPRRRRPDISLAQELLGWSPEVQLADGLTRTLDYFRALLGNVPAPSPPVNSKLPGEALGPSPNSVALSAG